MYRRIFPILEVSTAQVFTFFGDHVEHSTFVSVRFRTDQDINISILHPLNVEGENYWASVTLKIHYLTVLRSGL